MLASPGAARNGGEPPSGPQWQHEVKWDGVRLVARVREGNVVLRSRSGRDVSAGFPEFAALAHIADNAVFDGEAVAWVDGVPVFSKVVDRVHIGASAQGRAMAAQVATERPATYVTFDLLELDGLDLRDLPLRQRREVLESLWSDGPSRMLSQAYDDGAALFVATKEQGLEGVVSKRRDSVYAEGRRSTDWLKFPHRSTSSVVVGGWRPEVGGSRLGAVLVGSPHPGTGGADLVYRGRVGSGLAGRLGAQLAELIAATDTADCPFSGDVPQVDRRGTEWIAPRIVIDVAALGNTGSGRLRQPSCQRIRLDLTRTEVEDG